MKTPMLNISSKDVVLSGGDFLMVRGRQKLEHDLRAVLIERFDSDPYIRNYGSRLNELIGEVGTSSTMEAMIRTEALDAIRRHQENLVSRLQRERMINFGNVEEFLAADSEMSESMIRTIENITVDIVDLVATVSVTCTTFSLQTTTFDNLVSISF